LFHPILRRQLRKLGLHPEAAPDPVKWLQLLERVDGSYRSADLDRYTLERSLSLSSEEMRELTQRLQAALEQLRKLSMTDELTGLMNRRFLNVAIREEVAMAIRAHRSHGLSTRADRDHGCHLGPGPDAHPGSKSRRPGAGGQPRTGHQPARGGHHRLAGMKGTAWGCHSSHPV